MTKKELELLVASLLKQIENQAITIQQLNQTIDGLTQSNKELSEKIDELLQRINKNSKNSSKPPSSDGLAKPIIKSTRASTDKKQGGQTGHQGAYLSITSKPDIVIQHMPEACEGCFHYDKCKGTACIAEKRHVIDAVVETRITEHQSLVIQECPLKKEIVKGQFPNEIKATVQYGTNLNSLVVALNTVGAVSVNRTHEILSSVFNIPLSTGTISNMVSRCAAQ